MAAKPDTMTETQQNLLNTQNSLFSFMKQQDQVGAQIQSTTFQTKHKEATLKAISEIPQAPLYRGNGKVYYLIQRNALVQQMSIEISKGNSDLVILKNTKEYVDKKAQETETKLTELLKLAQSEQESTK